MVAGVRRRTSNTSRNNAVATPPVTSQQRSNGHASSQVMTSSVPGRLMNYSENEDDDDEDEDEDEDELVRKVYSLKSYIEIQL